MSIEDVKNEAIHNLRKALEYAYQDKWIDTYMLGHEATRIIQEKGLFDLTENMDMTPEDFHRNLERLRKRIEEVKKTKPEQLADVMRCLYPEKPGPGDL